MHKATNCTKVVEMIPDGATLMIGGFLGVGTPNRTIDELVRQGKKNLTIIANDTGRPTMGIGKLVVAKLVKKIIVSHIGTNPETGRQIIAGELEAVLTPQGTLVEQIRAGGYGLGGVLTETGIGTTVADGKQTIELNGKLYLIEMPLRADFAIIASYRADYQGNLEYALTARNFNSVMAMSADVVIAEPEHIVPVGVIPPDAVITPFCCVNYIIQRCN
jgi:acetate CoA/acetoacetate CoA-transferase alpha subunit